MKYILKPHVTEKMNSITEKFPNRFGFVVRRANKLEIKKEIEKVSNNATVVDVNTASCKVKTMYITPTETHKGQKPAKKVVVTLKEIDTIDFTATFDKRWQYVN